MLCRDIMNLNSYLVTKILPEGFVFDENKDYDLSYLESVLAHINKNLFLLVGKPPKNKYYIYEVRGVTGELLYIGKGCGERYKSHLRGTSHNQQLNRYFFLNGENGSLVSEIICWCVSEKDAFKQERSQIELRKPRFNVA